MTNTPNTYTCADCGGTFEYARSDEDAHAEAVEKWGVRGDAPGMAVVCDDCYRAIMATNQADGVKLLVLNRFEEQS